MPMAPSLTLATPMNKRSLATHHGLSFIEVLVALAIISIALTALIKAIDSNTRNYAYLQQKTTATLVGLNLLNQARLGLLPLAELPGTSQTIQVLGQPWEWQGFSQKTANLRIREIHITVANHAHDFTSELIGYSYVP